MVGVSLSQDLTLTGALDGHSKRENVSEGIQMADAGLGISHRNHPGGAEKGFSGDYTYDVDAEFAATLLLEHVHVMICEITPVRIVDRSPHTAHRAPRRMSVLNVTALKARCRPMAADNLLSTIQTLANLQ